MVVTKATYKETQEILRQSVNVLSEATVGYINPAWAKALQLVSPFLNEGGYYLVYKEDGVLQGWIGIGNLYDFYTDQMAGFIPELYVLPPYRKQGVAEKLCKEAFNHLQEKGYQKVQLNVFAGNRAKQLYEKLGFQDVCTLMERNLDH